MKKIFFISIFIGSQVSIWGQRNQVYSVGSMSDMSKENFASHISLDTLNPHKNLYGLGPLGKMQGEITVWNGRPYTASVNDKGEGIVNKDWHIEAPFFVYAHVSKWKTITFKFDINNLVDLEKKVAEIAKNNGYDLSIPFPFRLVGVFDELVTHIVTPRSADVKGYQADKKQADYQLLNIKGELLGFYSEKNQGEYTPKNSFIHVHFLNKKKTVIGHVDKIKTLKTNLIIYLPVN